MEERKKLLLIALKEEKERLPEYSIFGEKNDLNIYDEAIDYLNTGNKPFDWERNDLLYSIIEDFETICNDYGV